MRCAGPSHLPRGLRSAAARQNGPSSLTMAKAPPADTGPAGRTDYTTTAVLFGGVDQPRPWPSPSHVWPSQHRRRFYGILTSVRQRPEVHWISRPRGSPMSFRPARGPPQRSSETSNWVALLGALVEMLTAGPLIHFETGRLPIFRGSPATPPRMSSGIRTQKPLGTNNAPPYIPGVGPRSSGFRCEIEQRRQLLKRSWLLLGRGPTNRHAVSRHYPARIPLTLHRVGAASPKCAARVPRLENVLRQPPNS